MKPLPKYLIHPCLLQRSPSFLGSFPPLVLLHNAFTTPGTIRAHLSVNISFYLKKTSFYQHRPRWLCLPSYSTSLYFLGIVIESKLFFGFLKCPVHCVATGMSAGRLLFYSDSLIGTRTGRQTRHNVPMSV